MRILYFFLIFPAVLLYAVPYEESLIGYWTFDNQVGNTTADSSLYGNTAYTSGATWTTDAKFGNAYSFDGVDDFLQINDATILRVNSEVTVSAWIKPRAWSYPGETWAGIIAKGNNPRSYSLYSIASGLHVSTSTAGGTMLGAAHTSGLLQLNQWNYIVSVTRTTPSGGQYLTYVNGQLIGVTDVPALTSLPGGNDTQPVYIGKTAEAARNFNGVIDEVSLWNRALTSTEISQIYNTYGGNVALFEQAPEPTTYTLIFLGLCGWLIYRRQR